MLHSLAKSKNNEIGEMFVSDSESTLLMVNSIKNTKSMRSYTVINTGNKKK